MIAGGAYDTIGDLARRVRRWIAVEELLFETLGRWARTLPGPAERRTLATWCHRHAWHAELWRERMPAVDGTTDEDDVDAWLAPLRKALAGVGSTADALAVLAGPVVQALKGALAEHRDAIDPLLDGPTARVLTLVGADLDAESRDLSRIA
jgi:hypothetical protein